MNKKIIAIITELVPLVSAVVSYGLIISGHDSQMIRRVITVTMLLAFLGFIFFFAGRRIDKESKTVRVLGVLDCLTPVSVVLFYVAAIFCFGLEGDNKIVTV